MNDDDFESLAEQYRPQGPCATGCGHRATELWPLYKGKIRYEFRCHCCVLKARLQRAREYIGKIPELEKEYEAATKECA